MQTPSRLRRPREPWLSPPCAESRTNPVAFRGEARGLPFSGFPEVDGSCPRAVGLSGDESSDHKGESQVLLLSSFSAVPRMPVLLYFRGTRHGCHELHKPHRGFKQLLVPSFCKSTGTGVQGGPTQNGRAWREGRPRNSATGAPLQPRPAFRVFPAAVTPWRWSMDGLLFLESR